MNHHGISQANVDKRAHAHTQMYMPRESDRGMNHHGISQANVDKRARPGPAFGSGFRVTFGKILLRLVEQVFEVVGEVVNERQRVAELVELRHGEAIRQLLRRARRHLRHTHREKTAQAQCDAQCEPRAHTSPNASRKSNAANGEGDERGGDSAILGGDIGRSGDERGG